ncbi:hypothetical protein GCK32_000894 [Trichostrongylus colubriformis]|uniref:Uncharacterized protein n=1 Tax=Trichostrongylus colubriformis TaxID=6319 RepID=A0AAN8F3X4_TRICO
MPSTCVVAAAVIVLAVNSMADAIRLRQYRRPLCTTEQTCSYEAFGMVFALCDCPGDEKSCPQDEENAVEHRGTLYSFCTSRKVPVCEDGQISTTVSGIQTAIHCVCADSYEMVQQPTGSKDVTNYTCRQKRLCSNDEACGSRSFAGEMRFCDCHTGSSCVYPSDAVVSPLSRHTGKCVVKDQ